MQNLKRNWLISSKLTWRIFQILIRALENLKKLLFNAILSNKVYNVWAKNSIEELCLMTLNIDPAFEGKLTCAFKSDMRNLANFQQSTFERLKIGTLMGSFYPKWKMYKLQIYRGVLCHDNEECRKIWRGTDLSNLNWHEEFDKFRPEHLKISKYLPFNRLLLCKVYNIWAKKGKEELCLMALNIDAQFEGKLTRLQAGK